MLTPAEQATLAAVLDRLIPADETGPGACEAGVQRYVEGALAGPYAASLPAYREGLASLDAAAAARRPGTGFGDLPAGEQDAILTAVAAGGDPARRPFFDLVRQHAIEGMFGDPGHGGNVGLAGWKLIGFPGVRPVLSAEDQALGAVVVPSWEASGDA